MRYMAVTQSTEGGYMNESFLSTIAFCLLAMASTFIANLVVLVFTGSQWHVSGVLLAIAAMAAAYWSQHNYTAAAYARELFGKAESIVSTQAARESMDRSESFGAMFQYAAIGAIVAALVCFWLGMWK